MYIAKHARYGGSPPLASFIELHDKCILVADKLYIARGKLTMVPSM